MTSAVSNHRRRFVQGLAAGGTLAGLGLWRTPVWAAANASQNSVLSGTDFKVGNRADSSEPHGCAPYGHNG